MGFKFNFPILGPVCRDRGSCVLPMFSLISSGGLYEQTENSKEVSNHVSANTNCFPLQSLYFSFICPAFCLDEGLHDSVHYRSGERASLSCSDLREKVFQVKHGAY